MPEPAKSKSESLEQNLLIEAIYQRYHYDFRSYIPSSLRRRLQFALPMFQCHTLSQLQYRVLHEPEVFPELLQYLTVQVSDLFRDPDYFLSLRNNVCPVLRTYPSLKIWIAGCSTGEEVYSLATLLHEEKLLERTLIYATDINPHALRTAQAGIFDARRRPTFHANHVRSGAISDLADHVTERYGRIVFHQTLRDHIVFSDHCLATDSVFGEMQLVCCRNVLIYFERALQDRALGLFKDSLCHRGFLGLGSQESLRYSAHSSAFEDFDPETRVYRKQALR